MGATMGKNGTLLDSLPSTQVIVPSKEAKRIFIRNNVQYALCIRTGYNAHCDARP